MGRGFHNDGIVMDSIHMFSSPSQETIVNSGSNGS